MSKTKLMKLGPARPYVNCRGRGKLGGRKVKSGAVQKRQKKSSYRKGVLVLRKKLLNPPKETMIPISHKDFVYMGRLSLNPDVDYKLAKYHRELVFSGTEVTTPLLWRKAVQIRKELGYGAEHDHLSTSFVQFFLLRCGRFRAAKFRGLGTDYKSLVRFHQTYLDEVLKEERVHPSAVQEKRVPQSVSSYLCQTPTRNGHPSPDLSHQSTSTQETLITKESNTTVPEDAESHSLLNLFATSPDRQTVPSTTLNRNTTVAEVSEAPSLLNLFATSPKQQTEPSTTSNICSEQLQTTFDSHERDPIIYSESDAQKFCSTCTSKNDSESKKKPYPYLYKVKVEYEFPELLPERLENGYRKSSYQNVMYSTNDIDLHSEMECDDVYSELYDKLQGVLT